MQRRRFLRSGAILGGTAISSRFFARQAVAQDASPDASPDVPDVPTGIVTLNGDLAHSDVSFDVAHMVVGRVRGRFNEYTVNATFDQDAPENSSVTAEIQAASVDTKIQERDDHLRTADFLEVETYPTITFESTGVTVVDDEHWTIAGDLTIKDVTQPVELAATYNGYSHADMTGHNYGWIAETTISLKSFNVSWNAPVNTGGFMIGDDLHISIFMEAHPAE